MDLNLSAVLAALGPDGTFRIANEARPDGDYLFNTILPEENRASYSIDSGSMTIRATMAGLVGMDSPFPPGGAINLSTFLEQTAKIANNIKLAEATLRQLQDVAMRMAVANQPTVPTITQNLLNFLRKIVIQPHLDRFEWMRGQALLGSLDWEFNKKAIAIDYGIPTENILANRTGNDAYGGSASKFWTDVRSLRRALANNVRAIIAHGTTIDVVRDNTVNGLVTVNETKTAGGRVSTVTLRRLNPTNGQFSADVGDTVTIVGYNGEGEVLDPTDSSKTIKIPFMLAGKLLAIGNNTGNVFRVGAGGTSDPDVEQSLGYTHIAPTIEGGGRPGRWSRIFVPDERPWEVRGECVTNGLPVIENPNLLAIASTDMP
jgi:hypothetical protein